MPFLLDCTIMEVFTRTDRRHAFYELICWQSILGQDYSEDKFKEFLRTREGTNYLAPHETTWTPQDALTAFSMTLDTWCFSTREYMNEVLRKMVDVAEYAHMVGRQVAAKIESDGMSGVVNSFDKNTQGLLAQLHECINSDYINSTAKDASFRSFDEFKQWTVRFRKENLVWPSSEENEKLDIQLTEQVFGYSAKKCTPSICEILVREVMGFVNAILSTSPGQVPTVAEKMGEICFKRETDLFGWSAIFETLKHYQDHLVGQADRVVYFHPSDFSAATDYLMKIVKMSDAGTVNFTGFCVGLWMSGYQPAAIENTLEVMTGEKKAKGVSERFEWYIARINKPDFVHKEGTGKDRKSVVTGFAKNWDTGAGNMPRANWDEIVRFTNESMRGVSDEAPEEPERELVEENQVVSDKHAQPKGIAPDETKAEVEKKENGGESSMMPVAAFAAVIVGVLIFAR